MPKNFFCSACNAISECGPGKELSRSSSLSCPFRKPPAPANDNEPYPNIVYVAPDRVIRRRAHLAALAVAAVEVRDLHGLSRRTFRDWMCETAYGFEGEIHHLDGTPYEMGGNWIDALYCDDPSCRWVSSFFAMAARPPQIAPKRSLWPRLRGIRLCICIAHPEIARRLPR